MATGPIGFTSAVESYWVLGDLYHFLQTKKQGRTIAVLEAVSYPLPGGHPPFHSHANEDETFSIIEGNMNFLVDDHPQQVYGPGAFLDQPRGTKHTFWPAGGVARIIGSFQVTVAPAGLEDLFRQIGTKTDIPRGVVPKEPVPPTPEQLAIFAKLAPTFGITIHAPAPH